MRGLKRSIKIEKVENKSVSSVYFSKRRDGLFRKASKLCLLSPTTQIAILATPPSSNSHASFYSFGHSSVDHVVSSLLNDQWPRPTNQGNKSGLGFWWEDEGLDRSENVDELKDASEAITRLLNNLRLRLDAVKDKQIDDVILDEALDQLWNTETNNNEETTNQIPKFAAASGTESLVVNDDVILDEALDQLWNTETNNNEETTNQIPKFAAASGTESLVVNDDVNLDEFLAEFMNGPF